MCIGGGDSCEPRDQGPPGTATFAEGFRNRRDIPRADVDRFGGFSGSICPCPSLRDPALRRSAAASLRLRICHDLFGTWSVHGLSAMPVAHLPTLSAAFDHARRKSGAAPATIELLIDGFYVLVHQEAGWPRRLTGCDVDHPRPVRRRAGARGHHGDTGSVGRSRSSWFIKWHDAAIRSIAALAPGFMAMKRSTLDQTPI